jgi:hypothetical protein
MITVIKRMFRGTEEGAPSRFDREALSESGPAERSEEQSDAEHRGYFVPYDTDITKMQVELVRAAIAQGGRFGDHEIPIPWLRMMLAGLEGRPIDQDAAWEGLAAPPRKDPVEESPTYQELFSRRP